MTEDDAKLIAHDVVHGNYMRRSDANQLTGEWIIYAQHEGQNYYLCLGEHNSGDDHIRAKIDSVCVPEYSFLSQLLT